MLFCVRWDKWRMAVSNETVAKRKKLVMEWTVHSLLNLISLRTTSTNTQKHRSAPLPPSLPSSRPPIASLLVLPLDAFTAVSTQASCLAAKLFLDSDAITPVRLSDECSDPGRTRFQNGSTCYMTGLCDPPPNRSSLLVWCCLSLV